MQLKILAFGIAKDILGARELSIEIGEHSNVGSLKDYLVKNHPDFARLKSLALAVNQEYATDDKILLPHDEVVIIPPVSGG